MSEPKNRPTETAAPGGGLPAPSGGPPAPAEEIAPIDPSLTEADLLDYVLQGAHFNGAKLHISSMNRALDEGIHQIVTNIFRAEGHVKNMRDKTDLDRQISDIDFVVSFPNVEIGRPEVTHYKSATPEPLYPMMARQRNLTYSAPFFITARIQATATLRDGSKIERDETTPPVRCPGFPIMVHSNRCNLYGLPPDALIELGEDINDEGGYFIIKGIEYVVDSLENTVPNVMHMYERTIQGEKVRGHFISKPGDAYENSYQVILRFMETGAITVEATTGKFKSQRMPFFILFRLFGMMCDADIVESILCHQSSPSTREYILRVLNRAFQQYDDSFAPVANKMDRGALVSFMAIRLSEIAAKQASKMSEDSIRHVNTLMLTNLDRYVLPHMGIGEDYRIVKLRFLGHLINRLICCEHGIIDPTDRDSFKTKRVHDAPISMLKSFRTHFGRTIISDDRKNLGNEFKNVPFNEAKLVEPVVDAISKSKIGQALRKAITGGNKTMMINRMQTTNRMSSQALYWKNDLNVRSTLGQINTPDNTNKSKSSERSTDMRMPHPTSLGLIDPTQSHDSGEKVGVGKQSSAMVSICEATDSQILRSTLLGDPLVTRLGAAPINSIADQCKIFVNGAWIGMCRSGPLLYKKYRDLRRVGSIHPYTTIVWELAVREIYFWTDVGRLRWPLIIVYNNREDYVASRRARHQAAAAGLPEKDWPALVTFRQWVRFRREHVTRLVSREIRFDDLVREGVIEFITAEEQTLLYLCPDFPTFRRRANKFAYKYTHLVVPQAIFGFPTLASPHAECSQAMRNTMYTNHRKQSVGLCNLNYPDRVDKGTALQHYNEHPIISTLTDRLTNPNGYNAIVAIVPIEGWEQEDSILMNHGSADCGAYACSYYMFEQTELKADEQFGDLNYATTMDIKRANYSHIVNGVVKEGTIVNQDDVLIVKTVKLEQPAGDNKEFTHADRSIVYKHNEPMIVERVIATRNENDVQIIKVKLRAYRPVGVGDKLSSRHGNKGILSQLESRANMPFFEGGLIPDLGVNPQSITTRLALNQVIESAQGLIAAKHGRICDATIMTQYTPERLKAELEANGFHCIGARRMFNGITGQWVDALVNVGTTLYQRLNKFVRGDYYCIRDGPKSAFMGQPLDGRARDGGMRLGNMEIDALAARGPMRFVQEKFGPHSDGMEVAVCRKCGHRAIANRKREWFRCARCGPEADIAIVAASKSSLQLANVFEGVNLETQINLKRFQRIEVAPAQGPGREAQ